MDNTLVFRHNPCTLTVVMTTPKRISLLLLTFLLLFLTSCSEFLDPESAAVEAEAQALVRTLQSRDGSVVQLSQPTIIPILPTALPTQEELVFPTAIPTKIPATVPTETPFVPTMEPEPTAGIPLPTEVPASAPTLKPANASDEYPTYPVQIVNPGASGKDWQSQPVIPDAISQTVRDVYAFGQQHTARNPHFFSKIGDCQSFPTVFLGEFDPLYNNPRFEASDAGLNEAVFYFEGYNTLSYSVFNGMSAASALTTTWSDPVACLNGESAIHCELRIHQPAFVFVNLGTNWNVGSETDIFAEYLSEIVEEILSVGSVPILTTKTDNIEGDWSLNEIIARTAKQYDVPLFNAWRTIQDMPNHGLDPDRNNVYMTTDAWKPRSLAALRMLDFLARELGAY